MPATLTTTAQPASVHAKTGLPVQPVTEFAVGDLVTFGINSDGYPGVVVAVEGKGKIIYVAHVRYVLGNVQPDDVPGHNGYGDSATLVVDPESVEAALAAGKDGATKHLIKVTAQPTGTWDFPSHNECERMGTRVFHRARWSRVGGYGHVSKGASYRRDPHV